MPTVLLAEADRDLGDKCREYLARHGFQVDATGSGLDCVARLRGSVPDVLILDRKLLWGGANGVLAWLREERPSLGIAVLLTGSDTPLPDIPEDSAPLILDYVPKPFPLTALLERVRSAVARKEQREPSNPNRLPRYSMPSLGSKGGSATSQSATTSLRGTGAGHDHGASVLLSKAIDADVLRGALERVARMKEAERLITLGQAVATFSHEAGCELYALRLFLEILPAQLHDKEATLMLVAKAKLSERRLERLCEDMRGLVAPIPLERSVCDLGEIWRKAWSTLQSSWKDRDILFSEEINGTLLHLSADAFRLEQVFRNLFENTLTACPDPVRVTIRCTEGIHQGQPALRLVVTDNGPGLTEEQRSEVFKPFYTTKSNGMGMGLAICRRIIEAHAGTIGLGAGSGGTEFIIILPRTRNEPDVTSAGPRSGRVGPRLSNDSTKGV